MLPGCQCPGINGHQMILEIEYGPSTVSPVTQMRRKQMRKTAQPFLSRFGTVIRNEEPRRVPVYDPEKMLMTIDGKPAIWSEDYDDLKDTIITRVRRETTDDQ